MDLEVAWEEVEFGYPHPTEVATVQIGLFDQVCTGSGTTVHTAHHLVEAFCTPTFYVVASYDAIPIRSASVAFSIPHRLPSRLKHCAKPTRLHYGVSISHANEWSGIPHDASFRAIDEFTFRADFDAESQGSDVLGLSFVVQLEDNSWVRNISGEDFYIGGGQRTIPCTVEIPLSMPSSARVSPRQMISLFRANPFWLQPSFGGDGLHSCKHETQFVLCSLSLPDDVCHSREQQSAEGTQNDYVVILPLVDHPSGIRASIFGLGESGYAGIRLETGRCVPLQASELRDIRICLASFADDPYEAVQGAVDTSSILLQSFSSRLSKISSTLWESIITSKRKGLLNSLGYCTWDAYGPDVNEKVVAQALEWLASEDISLAYAIIDDGWQAGGGAGPLFEHSEASSEKPDRPTLSSFQANEKFSSSLRVLSKMSSVEIIAWVAIIGYWGGTSGLHCDTETFLTRGALPLGLHQNGIENPAFWEKKYEVMNPAAESLESFFESYFLHGMALGQGIAGVKIDAQSILEILCNPSSASNRYNTISRTSITATYRTAMMKAVDRAFPDSIVINCMACGPETIFNSSRQLHRGNVCWRTSNDHAFPGIEESAESVSWHILCNAMTSVLLGEIFPVVDWDMFRASDGFAHIHAMARVLSGGPIYFSDVTPFPEQYREEAKMLLKALTTHDGRILRCQNPGRPTLDCLFTDPRSKPKTLLKIGNRTSVLGLIGVFNLNPSGDEQEVSGTFQPADVEDFAKLQRDGEYVSLVTGSSTRAFRHRHRHDVHEISLPSMSAALIHICPVFIICRDIHVAILGQPHLLNAGGTLASLTITGPPSPLERGEACSSKPEPLRREVTVQCELLDYGDTYVWLDTISAKCLEKITVRGGQDIGYTLVQLDNLQILTINVPPQQPWQFELCFRTGSV